MRPSDGVGIGDGVTLKAAKRCGNGMTIPLLACMGRLPATPSVTGIAAQSATAIAKVMIAGLTIPQQVVITPAAEVLPSAKVLVARD